MSRSDLQAELLSFQDQKFKMFVRPGTLEIVDKRIIYTEGPYRQGDAAYDVHQDRIGVVGAMLKLARAFEPASQESV